MRHPGFYPGRRETPDGPIKVYLRPFGKPKLGGAGEDVGQYFQVVVDRGMGVDLINFPQQLPDFFGIGGRGVILLPVRTDSPAQAGCRIVGNMSDDSRIFHNLGAQPGNAVGSINLSGLLKWSNHLKEIDRSEFAYRSLANNRKKVVFKITQ